MTTRRDPLSLLPYTLVPLVIAAALLLEPARAQDEAIDLFDPSIGACASAPDAAWYYQVNGGSDERCQIEDIRAPLPSVAFKTVDAPSGTDPVADAKDDTLAITCAGLTCTGDSATDTLALAVETAELAPYDEYDPDKPPATCASCYEFTGTGFACEWGNQGSSTVTNNFDSLLFLGDTAANEEHVCGLGSPSSGSVDFTVTAKFQYVFNGANNDGCVLGVVEQGTIGSPTEITFTEVIESTTDVFQFYSATSYAYAGLAAIGSTVATTMAVLSVGQQCLQLRYTDSSRALTAWYSLNCVDFYQVGSTATLSADPPYFYIGARDGGNCRFDWVRARTDASRNQSSD